MSFPAAQKHLFYTELAKLLDAGFGIRDAGRVMLDTRVPPVQQDLLRAMDRELEAGKSITEALGSPVVTPLERSIIGAGERGGKLGAAFHHLADYFGMLASARREALGAMAYPAFLLHLGLFVGVAAPLWMSGETSPAQLGLSLLIAFALLYGAAALVWLAVRAWLRTAETSAGADRILRSLPVLGAARQAMAMARFSKVYHTALLAGLSMDETVRTASEAARSGVIRRAAVKLREAVKAGGPIGPAMRESGAFPAAFARSYATAEEAGGLDLDLARWTTLYQEEASLGARRAAGFLSKGAYFLVLLFIAWTVISFYLGQLQIMTDMLDE